MKKNIYITFFCLFLVSTTFSQDESIKKLLDKSNEMNLDMWDLSDFANEHIKDKNKLVRFFYYWISSNIEYDYHTYQKIIDGTITNEEFTKSQDNYEVYETRKGVCAGYANLFKWFMNDIDVESVIVTGHIRDEKNHYVEPLKDDNFRHAWNAVKLNGKWILVDSTWGTSDEAETSEFYFDMKPEWAIMTHFPEDSKWQLLEEPLTLEEFNNSKFVKPIWFFVGFSDIPKLMADEDFYYFVFNQSNTGWSVNLQYSTDNIQFEHIIGIEPITQDGKIYYRFDKNKIPEKAFFKVNISKLELDGSQYLNYVHKDVINFKI